MGFVTILMLSMCVVNLHAGEKRTAKLSARGNCLQDMDDRGLIDKMRRHEITKIKTNQADTLPLKVVVDSVKQLYLELGTRSALLKDSIMSLQKGIAWSTVLATIEGTKDDSIAQVGLKPVSDALDTTAQTGRVLLNGIDSLEDRAQRRLNNLKRRAAGAMPDSLIHAGVEVGVPGVNAGLRLGHGVKTGVTSISKITQGPESDNISIPPVKEMKVAEEVPNLDIISDEIQETADLKKVGEVSTRIDDARGQVATVAKFEKAVQEFPESAVTQAEKLPEVIEKRVENIEELQELRKEASEISNQQHEYEALIQRYKDKKLLQQEILRKSKSIANEKINASAPAVKDALKHIDKTKKTKLGFLGARTLLKKWPDNLKGKPLRHRLVPGMTFEVHNRDTFMLDLGLQTGYKVSPRVTVGVGYSYRIGISQKYTNLIRQEGLYGYRLYTDFGVIKNLFVHGEFLSMTREPNVKATHSEFPAINTHQAYLGLGKRYNISRNFKGSIIGLYRVRLKGHMPESSKIGLRVGIDYNTAKRKKKY